MLKKENRLKKKKDFDSVYKKGKTIAGKLIFLKILKNNLDINRFGFVVSKKISKKAVIRNKTKRKLREIIKKEIIKKGFNIIINTNPEILNKDYNEIRLEIRNLFKKAKLL